MLIIQAQSAGATTHGQRHALLAAIKDPANWRRQHDCRHALRAAIVASDLPDRAQQYALWVVSLLDSDGELYRGRVLADVLALSPLPRRTQFHYLSLMQRAGLIERHGTARRVGAGRYVRVVRLCAAAEFCEPSEPDSTLIVKQAADQRKCNDCTNLKDKGGSPVVSSSVGAYTAPGLRARARDLDDERAEQWEQDRERRFVRDHWPLLARSRTDVPLLRPGYSDNITFDDDARARLGIGPRRAFVAYDPARDERDPWEAKPSQSTT
jgi:hypothetical protein